MLNINKKRSYRKPRKNTALLTGIIYCKECGYPMRPRLCSNRFDEDGNIRYSYSCILKEKSRGMQCKGKNIDGNKIDKLFIENIKSMMAPNEKISNELKKIIGTKSNTANENEEYINLKRKYDKNQKMLDGLIKKIKYIDIDLIDDVGKEVKKIKKDKEILEAKINAYRDNKSVERLDVDVAKIVLDIIENHFNQFDTMDIVEKKVLIRLLVSKATGNGEKVEFDFLTNNSSAFFNTSLLPTGEYSK